MNIPLLFLDPRVSVVGGIVLGGLGLFLAVPAFAQTFSPAVNSHVDVTFPVKKTTAELGGCDDVDITVISLFPAVNGQHSIVIPTQLNKGCDGDAALGRAQEKSSQLFP